MKERVIGTIILNFGWSPNLKCGDIHDRIRKIPGTTCRNTGTTGGRLSHTIPRYNTNGPNY
jgi:hypothetical protein